MSQSDFVTRGQALVSSGQYQEAVKVCRLGLLGRPTTVEGRVVLGQALLALKRYDEVLAEMRVALELDHASPAAQALKGEALLRKGDAAGAVEVLGRLRDQAANHPQLAALLAEAERTAWRAVPRTSPAPAMSSAAAAEEGTKHYPAYQSDGDSNYDTGGFTQPTSIAEPGRPRPSPGQGGARREPTPSPAVLAVGDRSGTVEVDPELDGVEMPAGDDDFGDIMAPPVARTASANGKRGAASSRPASAAKKRRQDMRKEEVSTVELGEHEIVEVEDDELIESPSRTARRPPGPGTAVRNAVKLPSGPLDQTSAPLRVAARPGGAGAFDQPTGSRQPLPSAPPPSHLAQLIANQPHAMGPGSPHLPPAPLPPQPQINPRSAIAAALPTAAAVPLPHGQPMRTNPPSQAPPLHAMPPAQTLLQHPPHMPQAASPPQMPMPVTQLDRPPLPHGLPHPQFPPPMQMPPMPQPHAPLPPPYAQPPPMASPYQAQQLQMQQLPPHLQPNFAASRPTLAISAQQPTALDLANRPDSHAPAWARATMMPAGALPFAGPPPPIGPGHDPEPQLGSMLSGHSSDATPAVAEHDASALDKAINGGLRKGRSRLQLVVWLLIGAAVIGGGVFAGFQIRSMRLRRQIAVARDHSVDLAKADTWQGWVGARDSLQGIAQAAPTPDNRASLARARAVLAYEFGDGAAEAKAAIDGLAGHTGLDLDLATAYLALAQNDAKAARAAADRAQQAAPDDGAALYVSGQAALLAGDAKLAAGDLRRAFDHDGRPIYAAGLARALGAGTAWDEAVAAVDRGADSPAAVIAKGFLLAASGRAAAGQGIEIRGQLAKVVAEGGKPVAEQTRGVSPAQVAFAYLALAQVDFARNDVAAARTDYRASLDLGLNDQRFAEELSETLYAIGELDTARKSASLALDKWPASRRARTTLAQLWLAVGKPGAALELFTKAPDAASWPKGQVVRGQARLATGDGDGARADFDAALKKLPGFEPALIARAWLDLASGDVDAARQRIEPRFPAKGAAAAGPALVAVYAAIARASGDPAARARAKELLEHVVGGGPSPDTVRAQLELARIDRDLGDLRGARSAYTEAGRGGSVEARLETAVLQIESSDPRGGRETLEQLLKDAGDHPPATVLLETARARTLTGAHTGADDLLAAAAKAPGVVTWQLDRERARLAVSRSDYPAAAQALLHAFEACGSDLDTFILAADTVSADDKQTSLAAKLKALLPTRLKGRAETEIIAGKLDLAASTRPRQEDAEKHYNAARDALVKENASPRRRAQADYGLAAVAYDKGDDPTAVSRLELVVFEDPSIYAAYLFAAEIAKPKNPKKALELAQQATVYNPDSLEAWRLVGTLAAQLTNRRLLNDAINRVGELAPGSDVLRQLQKLR